MKSIMTQTSLFRLTKEGERWKHEFNQEEWREGMDDDDEEREKLFILTGIQFRSRRSNLTFQIAHSIHILANLPLFIQT